MISRAWSGSDVTATWRSAVHGSGDGQLLLLKLLNFFVCLANVGWGQYQGIYLNTHRHLSPMQAGAVRGGGLMAKLICTPVWGSWSDRGDPRMLMGISTTLGALLFCFYQLDVTYAHIGFLILLKTVRSGTNATNTLLDILTLRTVQRQSGGGSSSYGNHRLYFAVAWGVGSLVC